VPSWFAPRFLTFGLRRRREAGKPGSQRIAAANNMRTKLPRHVISARRGGAQVTEVFARKAFVDAVLGSAHVHDASMNSLHAANKKYPWCAAWRCCTMLFQAAIS